jgi:hypothetical protein
MRKDLTYNELWNLDQEIITMQKKSPALALLLDNKIKYFYQRAGIHIRGMIAGVENIKARFVQTTEDGKFKTIKIAAGDKEEEDWDFLPVYADFKAADIMTDRSVIKKIFHEKVAEFMKTTITIDL